MTSLGPYEIERELGRGAFGAVFKAIHRDRPDHGFPLLLLLLYVNFRVKRAVRVVFRGKERRCIVAFTVRRRALRQAFMETLRKHQEAARLFQIPTVVAVPFG
jgi:serine/threonine protein kinase